MVFFTLSVFCLCFWAVSSVVIDSPKTYQSDWIKLTPTNPQQPIELIFAIKQQNVDLLINRLFEISTPYTDDYGNWMTIEEVNDLVAPLDESISIVKEWIISQNKLLKSSDIISKTKNSDFISLKTTIDFAQNLLQCKYFDYLYNNTENNKLYDNYVISRMDINCDYNVPYDVSQHLDFISPTKRLPKIKKLIVKEINNDNAIDRITPAVLKSLYKIGDAVGKSSDNSEGIASFVRQYYSQSDLEYFWNEYDISADTVTHTDSKDGDGSGIEALLDTQYISSIGELVPLQVWYNEGTFANAMLNWLLSIQNSTTPPNLFSVSYGQPETDWGYSEVERLNVEFAKVTSLGITIFFASGDSGAGGGCLFDEAFEPEFPASSPYITSVGGVRGGDASKTPIGEEVWVDGGGGFSNVAGTQSFQSVAVNTYFTTAANDLPNADQYNATGRGYPDISAQSTDFEIVDDDRNLGVSGTSCASPTSAGVFALLNDLRFQNSMAALGYLNPFIYRVASNDSTAFNDVTDGYNKGCSNFQVGFVAVTGWDASSGWGSPNYEVLSKYVLETGEITKKHVKNSN